MARKPTKQECLEYIQERAEDEWKFLERMALLIGAQYEMLREIPEVNRDGGVMDALNHLLRFEGMLKEKDYGKIKEAESRLLDETKTVLAFWNVLVPAFTQQELQSL